MSNISRPDRKRPLSVSSTLFLNEETSCKVTLIIFRGYGVSELLVKCAEVLPKFLYLAEPDSWDLYTLLHLITLEVSALCDALTTASTTIILKE